MTDHRLVPGIRHRLEPIASDDVIDVVVELINDDPIALDECGFRFGVGHCIRVRGHESSVGDAVHVNLSGETKRGTLPVRQLPLF